MTAKFIRLASTVVMVAHLTGCNSGPDYTPIGDGLKAIAVCLVVSGIVAALADLVKNEPSQSQPTDPVRPRKPRKTSTKEEKP